MTLEDISDRLLYRDGLMLVVNKPAGLAVHQGPKGGLTFDAYFDQLRFGLPRAPSLAHRLDRDTSGCLILGRHRKALDKLGRLFKQGQINKTYFAVVEGHIGADDGFIDLPLARLDAERGWWMKVDPAGLPSQTRWQVMGRGESDQGKVSFVALFPLTGRTHQLRVHCAAQGWPIIGDAVYGHGMRQAGPMLHLHARYVRVPLSTHKPAIEVEAPVPDHMHALLSVCGFDAQRDEADLFAKRHAMSRPRDE
jgi:tRNA pseudouridine32 synthase / 23S rRNA pseudouridine746 synthase